MSLGGSAPQPADPSATAATQAKFDKKAFEEQQAASQVDQVTPFGNVNYTQRGTGPEGIPLYTATTNLSPAQQQMLNTLQGQSQSLVDGANYGAKAPADVIGGMTSGTTKDLLDKEVGYLSPYFTRASDSLDAKLRNQGILPSPSGSGAGTSGGRNAGGGGAYNAAMDALTQSQAGSVENFLANAEPAAYSQATTDYTLPLNIANSEIQTERGSNPALITTPQVPTMGVPNYEGDVASYNTANMQAYNANQANQTAMMSGLFGIGSAALGGWARSDARAKTNIKQVGVWTVGIPLYIFNYRDNPDKLHIGVLAQDVEKVYPEAVAEDVDGYKMVNYSLLHS